jgi:hypothetical protein
MTASRGGEGRERGADLAWRARVAASPRPGRGRTATRGAKRWCGPEADRSIGPAGPLGTALCSSAPARRVTAARPVAADGPILSDRIGFLPARRLLGHTRPAFTGAPHQYHRAARRMGAGRPIPQVARVLRCDAMDLHLLLREEPFAELFRAYCDLRELAPEERIRRLKEMALLVLEEALEEKDPRVAWFVLRECELGQDPALTLARGISDAAERDRRAAGPYEEPPPPPPARQAPAEPRPAAAPGDRVAWRTAARLREGVMEEAAGRRGEPPPPPRYDDAVLDRDLAFIRQHGQSRRSLPPDILDEIAAEPDMPAAQEAFLRRLYLAMPEGP